MRKALAYIRVAVAALMAVAATSCNNNGCLENQSAVPRCGFYSSSSKKTVSLDSISVYAVGVPGDSMLVRCGTVSQLYMPLDMSSDVTRYVLHYDAVAIGATITPWPIATMITAPLAGKLVARYRAGAICAVGMCLFALGFVSLLTFGAGEPAWQLVWRLALCGARH